MPLARTLEPRHPKHFASNGLERIAATRDLLPGLWVRRLRKSLIFGGGIPMIVLRSDRVISPSPDGPKTLRCRAETQPRMLTSL